MPGISEGSTRKLLSVETIGAFLGRIAIFRESSLKALSGKVVAESSLYIQKFIRVGGIKLLSILGDSVFP
jgi:hypothetical protein